MSHAISHIFTHQKQNFISIICSQVRLADGGRLIVKLNHTNTVSDLRRYITLLRPEFTDFSLHTTFPNKELTNDSATLKEADILGAAVLMRGPKP